MLEIPTSSLNSFTEALNLYEEATGKDGSEIINKAALNVAYRAAQFSPVAQAAEIKAQLNRDPRLVFALTSISLRKRGIGVLKFPEFQKKVDEFIARRVASRRYMRSGWAPAIIALGGTFRGVKSERGISGFATKASAGKLVAEIANILAEPTGGHAESAEEKLIPALTKAIDFVAEDMAGYATEKLAKTAKSFSP